jgi:tyrosine-protein phosphatase YwqE
MIDINNKSFNFYTAIDELTDSEFDIKENYLNQINFDQTIFVISDKYVPLRYKKLFFNQFKNIIKNFKENTYYAANEILLSNFSTNYFENQTDFHINESRFILVELSKFESIKKATETLLILINDGSIPIIVHPERNPTLLNIENITHLKSLGVLFQLSLGSMISFYPEIIKNTAHDFLSKGYYDFIATDFQNHKLLNSEQTNILLNELNSLIGNNKLNQLINTNPKLVLDEDLTNDYKIKS